MTLTRNECEKLTARPGKFEGEPIYSPYFYELMMDGMADETIYEGDLMIEIFRVDEPDRAIFPELKDVYGVSMSNDENGFIYCSPLTEEETNELLKEENL